MFDKYYLKTDLSPLYAAALILHPGRRTRYIEVNWPKKWVKSIFEKVQKLWKCDWRLILEAAIICSRKHTV